ncbi:site-specific integrase [Salipiger sp. IMCC34102]|uniref:tyrosine-type recombinase/integrase n=1 Tax=Salipiger sp. IMCC34102 TaxID=2510647 RepID=UPI00101B9863|nr:site-specific integrase [Salipiger sp. IMCC34102]RYH04435.1 site-specific integrase [Salipiger sp. IMCC34102]
MARRAKELGALQVKRITTAGMHAVGGVDGLYLNVTPSGTKSWILRLTVAGKRHELGLGPYPEVSLADARDEGVRLRQQVRAGENPVNDRAAARAAARIAVPAVMTFSDAFARYMSSMRDKEFNNAKHAAQWRSTLETYAFPIIGSMPVGQVDRTHVLQILEPIWSTKTVTAKRLRGRIENVLAWATVAGHREGDNPAAWKGNLQQLLPAPSKIAKTTHHGALALDDAPKWYSSLLKRGGVAPLALQFLALTAARSGEIRGALWREIDLAAGVWTIPADRMKMDREHRVALSPAALALLVELPRQLGTDLVFPGKSGKQMSDMTLSAVMKRMQKTEEEAGRRGWLDPKSERPAVPHGLRSTFRDWVAERTGYPADMAEIALAHRVGSSVEQAYRRGDMLEKRREMMQAWGDFLLKDVRR